MRGMRFKFDSTFGWQPKAVSRMRLYASSGVGAPAAGGAPSGGSPSPSPSPAPAPSGAPAPATGVPSGAPPASPTGTTGGLPSNAPNLDALRSSHEALTRFGGLEAVQSQAQAFTAMRTQSSELATKLGYTPESLEAAFQADPVGTYQFLLGEAAKAPASGEGAEPDLNQILDQRLGPIEQQVRMAKVEKVNGLVDAELGKVFGDHAIFKGAQGVPQEVSGFVQDLAREIMKYDKPGLAKMMQGDMAPVKVAFDAAIDRAMKMVNAFTKWQTERGTNGSGQPSNGQPPATGQPSATPNKWSLSDLIDGKEDAFQGLSTTRR
jgi:hypothetical protein